jgi:3-oxocholest-4-en-26-oate---CoA ligase
VCRISVQFVGQNRTRPGFFDVTEPGMHYATIWEAMVDRIRDRPALGHGERAVSWAQFDHRSAQLAGGLRALGFGPGDVMATYLYNCPEYLEIFFGALKIRAVPCNVNYRYTSDELVALLDNAEARVLFYDAALRDRVASVVDHAARLTLIEVGGEGTPPIRGSHPYEDLLATATLAPRMRRDEDDVFLSYTGGTTGLPKGVLMRIGQSAQNSLRFRDLFFGEHASLSPVEYAVRLIHEQSAASAIPASPLMHSTGFVFASLPTLCAGGLVTTLPSRSFDAHELLATMAACRAQVVAIVGDAFALPIVRALDVGQPDGGTYDTGSLRVICSAGVAWSAHIKKRLLDHLPQVTLLDACGATEGLSYGISQVRRGDPLSTTTFTAADGLKVLSPDGEELAPGEVGLLAGPTTASGYHRDPEKTAAAFLIIDGRQYAMPGDLGRINPDGSVTLVGRGVTTINTGGEKVYPAEVEEAIKAHPGVEDCLVLGVPDERFGQSVAALVVSGRARTVNLDELARLLRTSLAGYKVPRRIRLVEQVPRLPNGKIDYPTAAAIARSDDARGGVAAKK